MDDIDQKIREHWVGRDNVRSIAESLARDDPRLAVHTIETLAPRDQMHAGTLAATERFAKWAGVGPGERVLDLGSGLGGSARYLASGIGARVVAAELCEELHAAAVELTRRSGLSRLVKHVLADATRAAALGDAAFDVVWIQHVDMQVRDKAGFYSTAARCLAPGGRVVWHDWLAGPGGQPLWPVFWSDDGTLSFHVPETEFHGHLQRAGLRLLRLEPIEAETAAWFEKGRRAVITALSALRVKNPPPGERIRKLERLVLEMDNAIANTREHRMIPFFGEAVIL